MQLVKQSGKREYRVVFLVTLALKLLCLCQNVNYGINMDRIGDFVAPTALAGLDWSLIIPDVKYYGYGFKWIYWIFFALTDDPYIIYYCVMILYVILMSLIAVLIYHMQIKFLKVESVKLAGVIAVLMGLLGPVDFKSEPSVYMACWVACFLLLKSLHAESRKEKNVLAVLLPVFLCYTVTLHERMLAIIIGFAFVFFLYRFKFKEWIFAPVIYLPVQAASYFAVYKINDLYRMYFWGTTEVGNSSAIPSNLTSRLYFMENMAGLKVAIKCAVSNLVTLCDQTYGLAWVAIMIFVISLFLVREKRKSEVKHYTDTDRMIYTVIWFGGICVAIVIAGIIVSWGGSVYGGDLYGYKGFVYGRYYICFSYPALMAALIWLYRHRMKLWQILIGGVGYAGINIVFAAKIYPLLESAYYTYAATEFTSDTSLPWLLFYTFNSTDGIFVNYLINVIIICVVLMTLIVLNVCRQYKRITWVACFAAFLTLLVNTAGFSIAKPSVTFSSGMYNDAYQVIKSVEAIEESIKNQVIYTDSSPWTLQYLLNRYRVSYSLPDEAEENALVITTNAPDIEINNLEGARDYYYIQAAENQYIYFKGEECIELMEKSGISFTSMSIMGMTVDLTEDETSAISHINDRVVEIAGVEEEYTIVIVNDLHLIVPSDEVSMEYTDTVAERYNSLMVDASGTPSSENWLETAEEINEMDADLVIFAGDMLDYASTANLALLTEGMDEIDAPILYMLLIS
ncbi:MAG: hypothetical protein LUE90_02360 [Clostridiales bacterium]|nr:hypothetical protein [Clostridiales bacterium]